MSPELIVQIIQFGAMGLLAAAMYMASQQVKALTEIVAQQSKMNHELMLKLIDGSLTTEDVQAFRANGVLPKETA